MMLRKVDAIMRIDPGLIERLESSLKGAGVAAGAINSLESVPMFCLFQKKP
jgi:hypothetical protein